MKSELPVLPAVKGIGFDELFGDTKRAEQWYAQKAYRQSFICELIRHSRALQFADPEDPTRFLTVSPSLRGKKYMLGRFDKFGPVGHCDRNNPEDFVREIPDNYILVDMIV